MASARTTLSTCACAALPFVENDSSATRGSSRSTRRQLAADASAMSASASAVGSAFTAQSAKIERALREQHQEEARRRGAARREADRHHAGLDHARGRARGAGDHRVGVARLHHQSRVEQRLRREATRDLRIRVRASLEIGGGVARRDARSIAGSSSRIGTARSLLAQLPCRRDDPLVVVLRETRRADRGRESARNRTRERLQAAPAALTSMPAHSSFRIRATTRKLALPSGSITAASPSARYGPPTTATNGLPWLAIATLTSAGTRRASRSFSSA